jgi:hypothetical protein
MIACDAHPQHRALHTDRPDQLLALNEGVLHFRHFAKYANMIGMIILDITNPHETRLVDLFPPQRVDTLITPSGCLFKPRFSLNHPNIARAYLEPDAPVWLR